MRWAVVVLAAAATAAAGCGKKPAADVAPGDTGPGGTADLTGQPAYTVHIAETTAGKWRRAEKTVTVTTVTAGAQARTETQVEQVEYVETHLPPTAKASERLTRAYQVASETVNQQTRHRPYSGKTVTVEKVGDLYKFSVGGRELSAAEAEPIARDFAGTKGLTWAERLPGRPVRVGEEWTLGRDVLRAFTRRGRGPGFDPDQSVIRGKLVRVATEGGREWGKLEFNGTLVASATAPKDGPRTLRQLTTADAPIDGRPGEVRVSQRLTAEWQYQVGTQAASASIEATTERVDTPVAE
jgi:hypothetical protein